MLFVTYRANGKLHEQFFLNQEVLELAVKTLKEHGKIVSIVSVEVV